MISFYHFREIGRKYEIPYIMVKITWMVHPEYESLPEDDADYIMKQVWDYALGHTPPEQLARMRRLDAMHVPDTIIEKIAQSWLDDRMFLKGGQP